MMVDYNPHIAVYPKIQKSLLKQVVEGLGYAPEVCWSSLRLMDELVLQLGGVFP